MCNFGTIMVLIAAQKYDFLVFANQMPATALLSPTVHSEGVSRWRVLAVAVCVSDFVTGDMGHVTCDT